MPTRRVLIGFGDGEDLRFVVQAAEERDARRLAVRGEAVRDRDRWIAAEVGDLEVFAHRARCSAAAASTTTPPCARAATSFFSPSSRLGPATGVVRRSAPAAPGSAARVRER